MARRRGRRRSAAGRPEALPGASTDRGQSAPSGSHLLDIDRLRPWLLAAAIALYVARPLFPSESAAFEGDGLPVVMLWIALAVAWSLAVIGKGTFRVRFGWTDAAVVVLIAWHTVAAIWAVWQGTPRPAVNMLWEWIAMGLGFLVVRQLVATQREARATMAVMIALAVALAGYGLYQYFVQLPATRERYLNDPNQALVDAELWYEPGSPDHRLFEQRLASTEPVATFALANSLAGYLVPWLVVAAGLGAAGLCSRNVGESVARRWRLWNRVGSGLCALIVAACLLLTKSRSAYLAGAVGLVLAVWFCRPRKRTIGWRVPLAVAMAGILLLAAVVGTGGVDKQVLTEAGKSLGYRLQYWQATSRMITHQPLAGCGPGNFQYAYTRWMLPEASEEIADPHNFLLEVWATAGTPAAVALLVALGCWYWRIPRPRGPGHPTEPALGDGTPWVLAGGFLGLLLSIPLGMISAADPGPAAVAIALPLVALSLGLLWPWVRSGRLPLSLPAIGLGALLVNLLAAGGIGFPGVAGTMWLLLALGLNMANGEDDRVLPRGAGVFMLGATLSLAMVCYATAYAPVLNAAASMRRARQDAHAAEKHLRDAARADSLWAEPWKQLAALAYLQWSEGPTDERLRALEAHGESMLERTPNSASTWFQLADWHRQAFERTGRENHIRKAIELYLRAVDLYPTRSLYRAWLALALRATGDADGFGREATEALRLDALNPHLDKKLPIELRNLLERNISDSP